MKLAIRDRCRGDSRELQIRCNAVPPLPEQQMSKAQPQPDDEHARTWVLYDELAPRRKTGLNPTTATSKPLTVHQLEELLGDDETRTDLYPVPESGNPPK